MIDQPCDNTDYAVVTPLPPEETGIAHFSESIYKSNRRFDIFASSSAGYEKKLTIHDFWPLLMAKKYKAVLFTVGNSDHNLPALRLLKQFKKCPRLKTKLLLHIHDPVLTNVATKSSNTQEEDIFSFYKSREPSLSSISNCKFQLFEQFRASGLSYLINEIPISGCIVHSNSAYRICNEDLTLAKFAKPNFYDLFHPCFDKPCEAANSKQRIYDIGIFGVLDDGGKMSNCALESIHEAHRAGLIRKCVVAGYNASRYFEENVKYKAPFIDIFDRPSHAALLGMMRNTLVALQPRRINTGESSGVVPMLISQGCIPFVSNIGAFSEYPDSVCIKIDNSNFASEFRSNLLKIIYSRPHFADCLQYVSANAPSVFVEKLNAILDGLF